MGRLCSVDGEILFRWGDFVNEYGVLALAANLSLLRIAGPGCSSPSDKVYVHYWVQIPPTLLDVGDASA